MGGTERWGEAPTLCHGVCGGDKLEGMGRMLGAWGLLGSASPPTQMAAVG